MARGASAVSRFEFRLLGPLEVLRDGAPLTVTGERQRALLGLLLVHANEYVSTDRIVEELALSDPSRAGVNALQATVSRLRRLLDSGPPRDGSAGVLVTERGGYTLRADPEWIDVRRFERLAAEGRRALAAGPAATAAAKLRQALDLWRGPALADLAPLEFAHAEIGRLEEMRRSVVADRVEADLALGQGAELIGELEALVRADPLQERLRGQLMLALYRAGRQADALAAYRQARTHLQEELGLEPSRALQQLEQAILLQDVSLEPAPDQPAEAASGPRGEALGTFQAAATRALPRDNSRFTGRQAELERLLGTLAGMANGGVVSVQAIGGMAGIGKTTFAVHAAHRLAAGFPDGQFFLPLHAHTPGQRPVEPADALASLLLTAGVPAPQIPPGLQARAARWRDHVAGRKVLLVLDDAAGHEQVRPLLPGTAGSLVLITSRRRLAALEDAAVISLDTLPPGEASVLLARLAARPGVGAGDSAVGEIARLCGYLPLAIAMVASQLRHHPAWTVAGMAAELAAARDRLTVMHAENLSVAAAFGLSYAELTPAAQQLFRRLGLVPGPSFDGYAAAALGHTSLDDTRRCLDELYDQHLLGEPSPGRYQLHDLLREHARALADADDPAESDAAAGRLLDYYMHTALAAGKHIPELSVARPRPPGQPPADAPGLAIVEQAVAWLEAERPNLHAAADSATTGGRPLHAVHIAAAMSDFMRAHAPWDQAAALQQTALAAASQAGDTAGQAIAFSELGFLSYLAGDFPAAAASLTQAIDLYGKAGNQRDQSMALSRLGDLQYMTGDYPAAATTLERALALARAARDGVAEALALEHLGLLAQLTGDYPAAAAGLEQSRALWQDIGNRAGEADARQYLGVVQSLTGDYAAAIANVQHAVKVFGELREPTFQGAAFNSLGLVQQQTRDYAAAAANHHKALELFRELGCRNYETDALNSLGELSSRTSKTGQARDYHSQALAIAQDIALPHEEARALEGLGQACLTEGDTSRAATHLGHALSIYQRIGAPGARRVQQTLQDHGLPSTPHLPASSPAANPPDPPNPKPPIPGIQASTDQRDRTSRSGWN